MGLQCLWAGAAGLQLLHQIAAMLLQPVPESRAPTGHSKGLHRLRWLLRLPRPSRRSDCAMHTLGAVNRAWLGGGVGVVNRGVGRLWLRERAERICWPLRPLWPLQGGAVASIGPGA